MESILLHTGEQSHSFQPCEEGVPSFTLSEDSVLPERGARRLHSVPWQTF